MQWFFYHIFALYDSLLPIDSDEITKRLQMGLNSPQCGHKEGRKFPNFWWDNHQGKSSHIAVGNFLEPSSFGEGGGGDQWEAGIWSYNLRANERRLCSPGTSFAPLGESHGKGTYTHTHTQTFRLLDGIGPVARFGENIKVQTA
jgi:hypothetical protein